MANDIFLGYDIDSLFPLSQQSPRQTGRKPDIRVRQLAADWAKLNITETTSLPQFIAVIYTKWHG